MTDTTNGGGAPWLSATWTPPMRTPEPFPYTWTDDEVASIEASRSTPRGAPTRADLSAAIEAGARAQWEAMRERNPRYGHPAWELSDGRRRRAFLSGSAEVVVGAAPLIESQVREQIASEIEEFARRCGFETPALAIQLACRIARGVTS